MEEILERIAIWASHGTLAQFRTEIDGYLKRGGYDSELQDDELLFYRPRKGGGFLGLGAKTIKEPMMRISRAEGKVRILPEPLDEEFVQYLNSCLRQH